MENLAHSFNTPATDAAGELLTRIAIDPANDERYPDGTVLIPSDSADTSKLIACAIDEHRPIALVFPDGSDVLARPPTHRVLRRCSPPPSCGWPIGCCARATGRRSCPASG